MSTPLNYNLEAIHRLDLERASPQHLVRYGGLILRRNRRGYTLLTLKGKKISIPTAAAKAFALSILRGSV